MDDLQKEYYLNSLGLSSAPSDAKFVPCEFCGEPVIENSPSYHGHNGSLGIALSQSCSTEKLLKNIIKLLKENKK
jgi:hypothetical protein